MVDGLVVPEQLVLEREGLDGGGALVRVEVPLGLLREPALVVLGVQGEHVAPVARELRAVPRRVQPGEELVVARALVAWVADDAVALADAVLYLARHALLYLALQRWAFQWDGRWWAVESGR